MSKSVPDDEYNEYSDNDIWTISQDPKGNSSHVRNMDQLSDDQKHALEELKFRESMSLETDDDVDDYLSYLGEPPEYNVRQKLEQINREWGTLDNESPGMDVSGEKLTDSQIDSSQSSSMRHSKVGFKEQLVDLVAPAPNYEPLDDTGLSPRRSPSPSSSLTSPSSDHVDSVYQGKHLDTIQDDQAEEEVEAVEDYTDDQNRPQSKAKSFRDLPHSHKAPNDNEDDALLTNRSSNEDKCLIERDGQYILVSKSEMEAEDKSTSSSKNSSTSSLSSNQPKQRLERPKSAPSSKSNSSRPSRPRSTKSTNEMDSNYHSPYALSPEDVEKNKKAQKKKEDEKKKAEENQKKSDEEKRKSNEAAFEAWLSMKRKQSQEEKKKRESENSHERSKSVNAKPEESKTSVEEWIKMKRNMAKWEEHLRRAKAQEDQEHEIHHTEEERRKAFRDWKRRKAREKHQQEKLDRQRARITRLALRKSRRSRALAAALERASIYEFGGYRF